MEENDFVKAYSYFSINHVHDDYVHSWYEQTGDNGRSHSYKFTAKKGQEAYIQADFWDSRLYAQGCKSSSNYAKGTLTVY
jgi:hypothetical protein